MATDHVLVLLGVLCSTACATSEEEDGVATTFGSTLRRDEACCWVLVECGGHGGGRGIDEDGEQ
jgi:hypothetical protein